MEHVILVNKQDIEVGIMEKMEVHKKGILHRAFSIFIFNEKNEMLLQQRAFSKYHSGGLWTNACCSHPKPNENTTVAALRRLQEEMGFTTTLTKMFEFTYKAELENELIEYEFDHVFVGQYNGIIQANIAEVASYKYASIEDIYSDISSTPEKYTAWFTIAFPKVCEWYCK